MRAKEFLRLAGDARDQVSYEELRKLADEYIAGALELEQSGAVASPVETAQSKVREATALLSLSDLKRKG